MHILLIALLATVPPPTVEQQLVSAKARVMAADYGADLPTLRRLRDDLRHLGKDPKLGYLAHYWCGYASWRIALNGSSNKMTAAELKTNLADAIAEFNASILAKSDFADSCAAGSSVHAWLGGLVRSDQIAMRGHYTESRDLLARAQKLDPDNPRVLWVAGGMYLFSPPNMGGDVGRAMATYRRAIDVSGALSPDSPLPDWGKAESVMALAYAHMVASPPDLAAARDEANSALGLVPHWSYVRDVLIPQIAAAGAK